MVKGFYNESYRTLERKLRKTVGDEKTVHVLGSSDLVLGKWTYENELSRRFYDHFQNLNDILHITRTVS